MKKGNIISGILVIITSLFFFFNTFGFKKLKSQIVGADFMPRMYVFLLIILSIILIMQNYKKEENDKEEEKVIGRSYLKYSIITMLFLLGYVVLIPIIGFYISTIIFVLTMLYFSQVKNKIVLIGIPISTSLFIYAFFNILLKVSMPTGLIF